MASIVSSTFTLGHQQADGRRYVKETHTWDSGLPQTILEYGPVPDTVDHQAIANARAVRITARMAEQEFEGFLSGS